MNYKVIEELWQNSNDTTFILKSIVADDGKIIGDNLFEMWGEIVAESK